MLSAEALTEIVNAFGTNVTVDPDYKNRRAARILHTGKTMIFRTDEPVADRALAVQMRDISARGCSFSCKINLARGSNFVIQFSRNGQPPVGVLCTVVHCRALSGAFRVGAEFTCSLEEKQTSVATNTSELDRIRSSILT